MGEHLNTNWLACRANDGLLNDRLVDGSDLIHVQLTRQDHDVGELRIEAQGFDIGDIQLGGEVHFDPNATSIEHGSHVRSDDGGDLGSLGRINNLAHQAQVFVINNGIDREVTLHPVVTADGGNLMEVFGGEVIGTLGAHIEAFDTEVDRVSAGVDGCHQGLIGAHRCHYFVIFAVHL